MSHYKEITNNALSSKQHLNYCKYLDIACLFCKKTYRYFSSEKLNINYENTLTCQNCNTNAMIPITPYSLLYNMKDTEINEYIAKIHEELFSVLSDEDEYYCDYEYEEIKEEEPLLK